MILNKYSIALFTLLFLSCQVKETQIVLNGPTMGTRYNVKYQGDIYLKDEVDQLLLEINQSMSTYIKDSEISKFNDATGAYELELLDDFFTEVFEVAKDVHKESEGAFEPTVYPLLNYWGLGNLNKEKQLQADSVEVKNILDYVNFDLLELETFDGSRKVIKKDDRVKLDFNAIAKGYGVDKIAELLEQDGIQNYMVEIGGEVRVKGVNRKNQPWVIGITEPLDNGPLNQVVALAQLGDKAMAGSGNYRSFYNVDGKKYGHTINPKTGFPEITKLLGVSVVAENCMRADAYATTCMVKGLEEGMKFIEGLSNVEAYFIYNNNGVLDYRQSDGFEKYLKK